MFSFCTPNYNDGETLSDMIDSIFDQDYPNIELIVCDDGSTDNSRKILKAKQRKYKKLKIIYSNHKGACYARNLAAKEATGKYLSFLPADAILYPGVVRTWVNHLEDNPKYDFLYGGYKFVYEGTREEYFNYMSQPFDEYLLKVKNYIDGSFPLKKSLFDKMGGWDTNIKSLQDWDFWLNAVINHKAKGLYLPEVFFETTIPHAGGLSDDSHKNWLERTRQIKSKYGIKEKDICVVSKGAPFHGQNIAKILSADYNDSPEYKQHDYKLIYLLGFYPSMADICANVFQNHNGLRVVHWIGSDILQLKMMSTYHKDILLDFIKHNVDLNLTEFKTTQKELEREGIKSKILPLPPIEFPNITDMPKEFSVAVYMPNVNTDLYLPEAILEITKKCKNIKFKFFGNPGQGGKRGNIEYLGRLNREEINKLIEDSSCLLRLVKHDGLAITTEEFLSAGRRVITNVENIEHSIYVDNIKDAIKEIKKLKSELAKNNNICPMAVKYWRNKLSHKKFRQYFDKLLSYDPKEYWENRADSWEETQADTCENEKEIMKEIKKINPKSILDLGCGTGNWANKFKDVKYLGVDISSKLIEYAKKRAPGKKFIVDDIRTLNKVNEKYDLAFSYTAFLHVPEENMMEAVKAISRVAKKIIFIEPYKKGESKGFRQLHQSAIDANNKGHLLMNPNAIMIHDYDKYFNIIKRKKLGERIMYIATL